MPAPVDRGAADDARAIARAAIAQCRNGDDTAAALRPNAVHAFAAVKANDLAAYAELRAQVKGHARMSDFDRAVAEASRASDSAAAAGVEKAAQRLIDLVQSAPAQLFKFQHEAFVTVPVDKHKETYAIGRRDFEHWLRHLYYQVCGRPITGVALNDARATLISEALYTGAEIPVYRRIGQDGETIVLDLGDKEWSAAVVTPGGWRLAQHEVKFTRSKGMLALPAPVTGGDVLELRRFVNVGDGPEGERRLSLILAWLVQALRPVGPYPLLVLQGEQGSAKSCAARVLRSLVDPSSALLRSQPSSERDLMITAQNSWCLAYDNLSSVSSAMSDAFCRMSTGGGYATRELHTDSEETIFVAQRPVSLTGINELATNSDLLSRCLSVTLPRLTAPRPEAELWAEFDAARPRLLGALLTAMSAGLQSLPFVTSSDSSRLPDFFRWALATETHLGLPGRTFAAAYEGSRSDAHHVALESSPIVPSLRQLLERCEGGNWKGTATELLDELENLTEPGARLRQRWPAKPNKLSADLFRLAPDLREIGIEVERETRTRSGRLISLTTRGTVTSDTAVTANTEVDADKPRGVTVRAPGMTIGGSARVTMVTVDDDHRGAPCGVNRSGRDDGDDGDDPSSIEEREREAEREDAGWVSWAGRGR
jgi:hypothetical protein